MLIDDLLSFVDLKNSKKIFIGDNYKLSINGKREYALNSNYLKEKYNLSIKEYDLNRKQTNSSIINEALKICKSIKIKKFNYLKLNFADHIFIFNDLNKLKDQLKHIVSQGWYWIIKWKKFLIIYVIVISKPKNIIFSLKN